MPDHKITNDRSVKPPQNSRQQWRRIRAVLEEKSLQRKRLGIRRITVLRVVDNLSRAFAMFLRMVRLYESGYQNAERKVVQYIDLHFSNLPEAFASYKILHLTDLHLDFVAGTGERISRRIKKLHCDLCVLTGDYRKGMKGRFDQILEPMKKIVNALDAKDGILAVLGNHDTFRMADAFEQMGITVLTNETFTISRGNQKISVTGLDDPHFYYTEHASHALAESIDGFKIVIVHTPELYDFAAQNGYQFYLCGHTHGGQICLPGGIPVVTHLYRGKRFYKGLWQYNGMKGYTNQGCGVIGIPVRFNTQSEITLITLHNGDPPQPVKAKEGLL
ncbi:MAG: metallophosphoesterase family protein [Deltaproteobacteria bacterium]|nr:metallophosphoesterase family protein [Deltaproteobacteria bacterium]MBW2153874.1 metallophosphoesterase family protein [Deltaproteobacteria bacterium]